MWQFHKKFCTDIYCCENAFKEHNYQFSSLNSSWFLCCLGTKPIQYQKGLKMFPNDRNLMVTTSQENNHVAIICTTPSTSRLNVCNSVDLSESEDHCRGPGKVHQTLRSEGPVHRVVRGSYGGRIQAVGRRLERGRLLLWRESVQFLPRHSNIQPYAHYCRSLFGNVQDVNNMKIAPFCVAIARYSHTYMCACVRLKRCSVKFSEKMHNRVSWLHFCDHSVSTCYM